MSDDTDNYDGEGFDAQPAAPTAVASTSASSNAPSAGSPPLTLPTDPASPPVASHPLSHRSAHSTARSAAPRGGVKSPKAASSAQSALSKKKAAALLEGASNPGLVISQLQEWNEQLTAQTTSQAGLIASLQQLNAELEAGNVHHQRAVDDVSAQLQSLTSTHAALKATHTASLLSIARLEASQVELLSTGVKERSLRQDLEGRLQKCEVALKRERDDCVRLKAERKDLDVQRRVQDEQWAQEKLGWRTANVDLLTRIEALDDAVKHHKATERDLHHQLATAHSAATAREAELGRVNEELLTAIRRANEHADAAQAAQAAIGHVEEQLGERVQRVLELDALVREQRETIRLQADRISSVVFQMGRMDEWKAGKEEEEREKAAVLTEMRGVVESQEKAMNTALLSKERSDSMIGILEDRLGKEAKRLCDLRDKQAEAERTMKAVVQALREKEAEHDQLSIKLSHVSSKWSQEQSLRAQERKAAEALERRFLEQREQGELLLVERQRLEDEKVVREEMLRELQAQLDALRKKDDYYRKIQDMLASSNAEHSQSLLALLTSSNEKFLHYTNPVAKGKLKTALLGNSGQRVKAMLRRCDIDPKQLLDWCIEPQRLVDGLHGLLLNVKHLRNAEAFGGRRTAGAEAGDGAGRREGDGGEAVSRDEYEKELELLNGRNAELNQALVKAEADKSKALMRLVTLCAGPAPEAAAVSPSSASADPTFLTELDAADPDAQSALPSTSPSHGTLDQLVLSEMGLVDSHVALIAPHIHRSRDIREVDLRGNGLTNASAVAMVAACLEPGNRVHMVDLQQNLITLDGLEDVAMMVMRHGRAAQPPSSSSSSTAGEEKEHSKPRPGRLHSASLYRQGNVLLPILQLRLSDKLLLVDLRYNRLQHLRQGTGGVAPPGGESVKQVMKRVLLRVCRVLNSVGQGSSESMDRVDWDARTTWMTDAEVDALVTANAQRKADEDRRRTAHATAFDTAYTPAPNRRTSGLDQRNISTVRPVLPPPPRRTAGKAGGVGGLPRIGSSGGKAGSRRGSGVGGKSEEETKVQDDEGEAREAVVEAAATSDQVEGRVDAADDDYGDDFAQPDATAAAL